MGREESRHVGGEERDGRGDEEEIETRGWKRERASGVGRASRDDGGSQVRGTERGEMGEDVWLAARAREEHQEGQADPR
jgi:hypothetical protein